MMTLRQRPSDLPTYRLPPVAEVVLGVRFDSPKLIAPLLGLFWDGIRDQYPRIELHPAIEANPEPLDDSLPLPTGIGFRMMDKPETPRCWFLDSSGNRLIQVQENGLFHNWRKVAETDAYPRYEGLREAFERELTRLDQFGKTQSIGGLVARQCEVTFINFITSESWGDLSRTFSIWCATEPEFLPRLETGVVQLTYLITDSDGKRRGRLRINVQPALRKLDSGRGFRVEITARGAAGPSAGEVMSFLDLGHDWIVRAFTAITTPAMHALWERE